MTARHDRVSLLADARAAVAGLAALRHRDPAASGAVRAIKLAQFTIERCWLPALRVNDVDGERDRSSHTDDV